VQSLEIEIRNPNGSTCGRSGSSSAPAAGPLRRDDPEPGDRRGTVSAKQMLRVQPLGVDGPVAGSPRRARTGSSDRDDPRRDRVGARGGCRPGDRCAAVLPAPTPPTVASVEPAMSAAAPRRRPAERHRGGPRRRTPHRPRAVAGRRARMALPERPEVVRAAGDPGETVCPPPPPQGAAGGPRGADP
jgi:hypothetical protein